MVHSSRTAGNPRAVRSRLTGPPTARRHLCVHRRADRWCRGTELREAGATDVFEDARELLERLGETRLAELAR